jgi:holliday junction DNA helicase RuvA
VISLLKGTIESKQKDSVVLMTAGGVGYAVRVSRLQAEEAKVGVDVILYTYLKVSDNAMDLFGFSSVEHRSFFSLLLSVKSVGPKSAMHILSIGSVQEIQSAISRGDVDYLTSVQGMGKKTAERIVVELKSKIKVDDSAPARGDGKILGEVIDGLVSMGYGKEDAKAAVQSIETEGKTTEQVLREALRSKSK